MILRAMVAALMDKRSMLSSITRHNCYGQNTSGAWAHGLATMRVLGDLAFEVVIAHFFHMHIPSLFYQNQMNDQ